MTKSRGARLDGEEPSVARSRRKRGGEGAPGQSETEGVRVELARVRARFGLDPASASPVLARAWTSPSGPVEEDEAEFVDALADCLSVGLPLTAAVASWASGTLAQDDRDDEDDDDDDQDASWSPAEVQPPAGRRIFVR